MCQIIVKHRGGSILTDHLTEAATNNPDGIGLSYSEGKLIKMAKGISLEACIQLVNRIPVEELLVVHFRLATSGLRDTCNLHPFLLPSALVFHNGVINSELYQEEIRSDTAIFTSEVLAQLPANFMSNPYILEMLAEATWPDRFVFVGFQQRKADVQILNQQEGLDENGCWYSNDSHLSDNWIDSTDSQYDLLQPPADASNLQLESRKEIPYWNKEGGKHERY
ncbi:MAG: hypothetical protein QF569_26840 [Candidatus Poribacteria bacterium]|jgi:hypothetical protein|nr:hypothetical protein [Candidatus Poribacteria bacterium]